MARGFTRMVVRRTLEASHVQDLPPISLRAVVSELVAMTLFVYIGCGTAVTFSSRSSPGSPFERGPIAPGPDVDHGLQQLNDRILINSSWGITTAFAFGLAIVAISYVSLVASCYSRVHAAASSSQRGPLM